MIKFKIKKKANKIYYVTFPTISEMNVTMLRFQEVYESPNLEFRDKPFSREQYYLWYGQEYGKMSYYTDWTGFNLSVDCISKVRDTFLDLWDCERDFADALRKKGVTDTDYVICYAKGDKGAYIHEFAHALFFTNFKYRMAVLRILECIPKPTMKKIKYVLLENKYAKDVILDETQAYIVDGIFRSFDFDLTDYETEYINKAQTKIQKLIHKYG